ncbi:MAG: division/cell wall cluster transcriptional repressor MraZ [Dermatophilaceae bacterium]
MTSAEFLGLHNPRLDEKGRLILPARFRDDLGERIVVTKGPDRCVVIYPHAEFKARIMDPLAAGSSASRNVRALRRAYLASASTETLDRQGRVTIPPGLRTWGGLDKECTVIGQGSYIEVWDSAAYARIEESSDDVLDALDEEGVVLL